MVCLIINSIKHNYIKLYTLSILTQRVKLKILHSRNYWNPCPAVSRRLVSVLTLFALSGPCSADALVCGSYWFYIKDFILLTGNFHSLLTAVIQSLYFWSWKLINHSLKKLLSSNTIWKVHVTSHILFKKCVALYFCHLPTFCFSRNVF